jgi:hypothetical protein
METFVVAVVAFTVVGLTLARLALMAGIISR